MSKLTNKILIDMPDHSVGTTGWNTWANYVLKTLEELTDYNRKIDSKVEQNKDTYIEALNNFKLEVTQQFGDLKNEIGIIKTKTAMRSALIGALTTAIPSVVYLIYTILS